MGLYIGGGYAIEARGAYYGVVKTAVKSRSWVEWGELKGVDYSEAPAEDQKDEETPVSKPTVRKGNRNKYVTEMQQMLDKLGYSLGICGVDGDFGTATEKALKEFQRDHGLQQDGICGEKTWKALTEAAGKLDAKPAKKYTVTISNLTEEKAKEITQKYGGVVSAE